MEKLKIERMNGMTEEELNKVIKVDIQLDIDKLNRIYDLEKELGISLEVIFKALKNGIWSTVIVNRLQKENQIRKFKNVSLKLFEEDWGLVELIQNFDENLTGTLVLLKDYGDTWALTKEELK